MICNIITIFGSEYDNFWFNFWNLYLSCHFVLFPPHLLKIQRLSLGAPKIFNFWGEEKWRQAHFDEGAVVIYYGVPCKSVAQVYQKDLFRFLPVRARR